MRKALLILLILIPAVAWAQPGFGPFFSPSGNDIKRPAWRRIANMFTIEGSIGHGATLYSHDVSNIPLVMTTDSVVILGAIGDTSSASSVSGLIDWLNVPTRFDTTSTYAFAYGGDSVLGFRALNSSIPVSLRIYYSYDRYRIGAGIHYEWQWFRPMNPTAYQEQLGPYRPRLNYTTLGRYYVMVGARFYTYKKLSYVADLEMGMVQMGRGFEGVQPPRRFYLNIGFPIEYNFSEYLRVYLRPSFEFKSYQLDLGTYSVLQHSQNAFYTQLGMSFTIPEIPKCPVLGCKVQMKHLHQGHEFRGAPLNKVQSPGYGENHPVLEKHKWRPFQRQERAPTPKWWQFRRRN
ncbi:MAG: hypothetical protein AAFQ98_07950 [Bacteroidota bacterium]